MTGTIEMIVSLKVPDTTAITALQTLQKLGFDKIKNIKRSDYYNFLVEGSEEKFKEKISKVDIIVNANKHSYDFSVIKDKAINLLVKNINGDGASLLSTLKNRLGFDNIQKVEKSILWTIAIDAAENEARKIAEKAAKDLLANEHYQEYMLI